MALVRIIRGSSVRSSVSWQSSLPQFWKHVLLVSALIVCSLGCSRCGGSNSSGSQPPPPPQNPTPTLNTLAPNSANAGGTALTVTATGSGFISESVIQWNGAALATTFASSTSITAQIPATDLAAAATAAVTVANPAPGGGTSGNLPFTIHPVQPATNLTILNLEGSDLTWNPSQQKLYVAVPSTASSNASTIAIVDPTAGSITGTHQLPTAASGFAISDDSSYLYAVVNGAAAIQRFTLPTLTPDIQWSLGTDTGSGKPYLAGDIKVQPGAPHALAVSYGDFGIGSVGVFDDAVQRASVAGSGLDAVGNSLQWKQDGTQLYAAYSIGNDSPFFSSTSDEALYVMPVSNSGVGAVTTYHSSFRGEGVHLHSDPATGFVFDDWGEVVNSANGIPVGNFRWSHSSGTSFPGPLSVVDPSLKLFFTLLEVSQSDNSLAFQIQAFDQTNFQLLHTIVITNVVGQPTNFIRWGQSGLAFVTNGGSNGTSGQLYILDGNFVNPSGAMDTSVGTPINPVPTLTAISPLTAVLDGQSVSLTVTGRDFIGQPSVFWNGQALATSLVSSTELMAQIPASDLTAATQATITVSNSSAALPASNSLPFSVNVAPPSGNQISVYSTGGNNVAWSSTTFKLYVSMPGLQGDSGDAIGIIDPVAGTVSTSGFIGSDPAALSLTDNGQFAYVALYGQNAILQLTFPGFTPNATWNLGGVGQFEGPYYALDLQAAPAAPHTTAVTLANFDVSPSSAAVVIYDDSTPRSNPLESGFYSPDALKWGATASTLYAVDQGVPQSFLVLGVGPSGAVLDQHYDRVFDTYSPSIHFDAGTGLVYTDAGQAIQPSNGTIAGTYNASGILVPDSTLGRVFILGQTAAQVGTSNYTIESFDETHFTSIASLTIQNVVGTPTSLVRWGTNGLAFTTRVGEPYDFTATGPGQLYVVSGSFVNPTEAENRAAAASQSQPVKRTWNVGTVSRPKSRSTVVHPSPWRR